MMYENRSNIINEHLYIYVCTCVRVRAHMHGTDDGSGRLCGESVLRCFLLVFVVNVLPLLV